MRTALCLFCFLFLGCGTSAPEKPKVSPKLPQIQVVTSCQISETTVGRSFTLHLSVQNPGLTGVTTHFDPILQSFGVRITGILEPQPGHWVILCVSTTPGDKIIDLSQSLITLCGNWYGKDICVSPRQTDIRPIHLKVVDK